MHEIFVRYLSSRRYKNIKFEEKNPNMKISHFYNIRYLSSFKKLFYHLLLKLKTK
jgi:hypothetical protein